MGRGRILWLVLFTTVATNPHRATGQEAQLEPLLEAIRDEVGAPGAILGLRLPGQAPIIVSTGLADVESGTPMRPGHTHYIGSVSKSLTAAVILRLAEEGALDLDEPLANFLPDVPRSSEVTIRDLLAHTSGLRDFYSYLYFRPEREEMVELVTRPWSHDEVLELIQRFGYSFAPGSDWAYSNTNYYLLGWVIELSSGQPLHEAYRRFIYEPVGMSDTWLAWHERGDEAPGATGYMGPVAAWDHSEMFGELGPTTVLDRSPVEWGAGGVASTVADGLRFLDALVGGELLSEESTRAMLDFRATDALGVPGDEVQVEPDGYGLGAVRLVRPGGTLVGHGGLFMGHTSGWWYIPACDMAITLYFNRGFVGQRVPIDRLLSGLGEVDPVVNRCRAA